MEDRSAIAPAAPDSDARVAALERDLADLRALLAAYIHDREAAEEALRESEARYHALVQRAAFGVYRATPDGRYLDANPALVAMLGYSSEAELKALDIADAVYVDPADRQRVLDQLTGPAAERGSQPVWMDVHWRRRDGRPIRVRLSARMVRDAEGEPAYLEGIAEDVTERARNDELLRRSERMASLGNTLAGVAHEINNPLAAVGGFAQLLLRGAHDWDEDDRSALETIAHEAARAGKIVRDLLTFARRQEDPRHTRVLLNDVVRYILAAQRYALATHGVRHEVTLAPALPPVLADAAQIEQVVLNLVVNARQALESEASSSPGEPRLTVRTAQDGAWVVLEVADNGPGISADDRQRIFDPFFTTKGEGEGTGLGLSVVHGIVASHGGSIDLESTLGTGTRFIVRLPAASPASTTTAVATDAERGGAAPAAHALDVLLVDSDAATVGFLTRYLSSRGHAVVSAADGAGALRLAEQGAFDVIVCDLGTDGGLDDATAATLRGRATAGGGRFIATTTTTAAGSGTSGGLDSARALPRTPAVVTQEHVLEKPYDVEALRRAVEERG